MRVVLLPVVLAVTGPALGQGKIVHVDAEGVVPTDESDCGRPRDFSRISPSARSRVVHFWRFVAVGNAERIRRRRAQLSADLAALSATRHGEKGLAAATSYEERWRTGSAAAQARAAADIQAIDRETLRARAAVIADLSPADRTIFAELTLPRLCQRPTR